MTTPETQMTSALKAALDSQLDQKTASPAPAAAPAAPAKTSATTTPSKAVRIPAAKKPEPAKATPSAANAKPAAEPSQLNVGEVLANAAVGKTVSQKPAQPQNPLPPHLVPVNASGDVEASDPGTPAKLTLEIFGEGCLTCRALVDDPELEPLTTLPKCHFSRDFPLCPAKFISIRAIGEQRIMARKIVKARDSGNVIQFTRLMSELANQEESFQLEVLRDAGMNLPGSVASTS